MKLSTTKNWEIAENVTVEETMQSDFKTAKDFLNKEGAKKYRELSHQANIAALIYRAHKAGAFNEVVAQSMYLYYITNGFLHRKDAKVLEPYLQGEKPRVGELICM